MSLYNMMNLMNPAAGLLLRMVNMNYETIPRLRDAWINSDFTQITILTRTGGGNRNDYKDENQEMKSNPLYISDEDDSFDCTYAKFYYSVPENEKKELLDQINAVEDEENRKRILENISKDNQTKFNEAMNFMKEGKS